MELSWKDWCHQSNASICGHVVILVTIRGDEVVVVVHGGDILLVGAEGRRKGEVRAAAAPTSPDHTSPRPPFFALFGLSMGKPCFLSNRPRTMKELSVRPQVVNIYTASSIFRHFRRIYPRWPMVRESAMYCSTTPEARLLGIMADKLADGHWLIEV